jgi:hypothetical protein
MRSDITELNSRRQRGPVREAESCIRLAGFKPLDGVSDRNLQRPKRSWQAKKTS